MCVYIYIYIVLIEKKVDISHISHTTQHICNLQKLFNQKKKEKGKRNPIMGIEGQQQQNISYVGCMYFSPYNGSIRLYNSPKEDTYIYIYMKLWYNSYWTRRSRKKKSKNKKLRKFHYPLISLNIYFSLPLPLFSHWPKDLKNELCTINLKYFFKEQYSQNLKNN